MLLPSVKRSKQNAVKVQCQSILRQWHLALNNYLNNYQYFMPITRDNTNPGGPFVPGHKWYKMLEADSRDMFLDDGVKILTGCPAALENKGMDTFPGVGYQYHPNGNVWTNTVENPPSSGILVLSWVRADFIRNPSNTPCLFDSGGEAPFNNPYQSIFGAIPSGKNSFKFRHLNTGNIIMMDGSGTDIRGNYEGESSTGFYADMMAPGCPDAPENPDDLFTENRFDWHYKQDPYN